MQHPLLKAASILFILLCSSTAFALGPEQAKKWSEDIDYYYTTLSKRHINLYHTVSEEKFTAELDLLKSALPDLTEQQIVMEMLRITSLIGDGHTHFSLMSKSHRHFPLRYKLFSGDIRVVKTADSLQDHLGSKLVAIDGKPIADILKLISPVVQGVENDYSLNVSLAFSLTLDEMLYVAGITQALGNAQFSFEDDAGKVSTVSITPMPMGESMTEASYRLPEDGFFRTRSIVHSDGLWLSHNEATKTAYLYLSSYHSFEEMAQFAGNVRQYLGEQGAKNLIIDLRDNEGGDFLLGLLLISDLLNVDSLDWNRGIYTLIGYQTFSAGMSNATHFRQIMNAKLVGEPTGANPNGPQEIEYTELPNSKYRVGYSTRLYRFQDTATPGVQPDVLIKSDWHSAKSGKDQALRWIMNDIKQRN